MEALLSLTIGALVAAAGLGTAAVLFFTVRSVEARKWV